MKIRQLSEADATIYRELRLLGLKESPAAFGASYAEVAARPLDVFRKRLGDEQNHTFGAFDDEGRLAGVTMLRWERREKTGHKGTIYAVYVRPEYRGQGAGRALMEAALARARELGLRQVNLGVSVASKAAIALYEACGFEEFGREKHAFKVGTEFYDAIYMVYWVAGGA